MSLQRALKASEGSVGRLSGFNRSSPQTATNSSGIIFTKKENLQRPKGLSLIKHGVPCLILQKKFDEFLSYKLKTSTGIRQPQGQGHAPGSNLPPWAGAAAVPSCTAWAAHPNLLIP